MPSDVDFRLFFSLFVLLFRKIAVFLQSDWSFFSLVEKVDMICRDGIFSAR